MIVSELYEKLPDGTELIRTTSDQNKYIRKVGTLEIYEEAVDVAPVRFQYEETNIDIEPEDEPDENATQTPELTSEEGSGDVTD